MIYYFGCFSFISFLILLLFVHFAGAIEHNQVTSIISQEIEKQKCLEAVVIKYDNKTKIIENVDQIEVLSVLLNDKNNFSAMVNTEDGKGVLNGTYYEAMQIPVLKQPSKNGTFITDDMVNMIIIPTSQVKSNYITKKEDIIGKVTKRRILPGKAIKENDLELIPLIKKGGTVTIRYVNKNLSIETSGISTENGFAGKMIKVKNIDSNRLLHGVVVAEGVVEVKDR